MAETDLLFSLAELSVGLAGFSAIVVLFRRRESGKWRVGDADRFRGMVLHAMSAALFCIVPAWIAVFVSEPARIWTIASGLLGADLAFQSSYVLRLPSTEARDRIVVAMGYAFAALQALNAFGVGFAREFGPYLAGVLWHVFSAGFLFVYLIWIRAEEVEPD